MFTIPGPEHRLLHGRVHRAAVRGDLQPLKASGFGPALNDRGNPMHQTWTHPVNGVTIDFLIDARRAGVEASRTRHLAANFAAFGMPGLEPTLQDRVKISIGEGPTPDGDLTSGEFFICGPGSFMCSRPWPTGAATSSRTPRSTPCATSGCSGARRRRGWTAGASWSSLLLPRPDAALVSAALVPALLATSGEAGGAAGASRRSSCGPSRVGPSRGPGPASQAALPPAGPHEGAAGRLGGCGRGDAAVDAAGECPVVAPGAGARAWRRGLPDHFWRCPPASRSSSSCHCSCSRKLSSTLRSMVRNIPKGIENVSRSLPN